MATQRHTHITKLVLSAQATRHFLEFCETVRRDNDYQPVFPGLEEMVIRIPGCDTYAAAISIHNRDKDKISRLLDVELVTRHGSKESLSNGGVRHQS